MTERQGEALERPITFMGREMYVKLPSGNQLLVWQRTVKQLQNADTGDWNGAQALAALERLRKIFDSVLANRVDIEWLDEQMLDDTIGLPEISRIMMLTLEAFGLDKDSESEPGNRTEKRAAKKAARKAPART